MKSMGSAFYVLPIGVMLPKSFCKKHGCFYPACCIKVFDVVKSLCICDLRMAGCRDI